MTSGRFHLNNSNGSEESNNENNRRNNATDATTTTTTTTTNFNLTADSTNLSEHNIRKFVFTEKTNNIAKNHSEIETGETESVESLEIKIPELLQSGYSFYTWPSAPVLAWFLWEKRRDLVGKRILELGAGTALPGVLAAKCGAHVTLSDNCILPKSLAHIRKSCLANELLPGRDIEVIGLSWGLLLHSVFNLGPIDFIIAADCFYDPSVFEDIIVTVSFLLERNPGAKFLFTYQERSADWSIESLLKKWRLCARQVDIDELGKSAAVENGFDLYDLIGRHTIHLIEITKNQ